MAYYRKVDGGWRVEIARRGQRRSATFAAKAAAVQWATAEEAAILAALRGLYPRRTLGDALRRYESEVSSRKSNPRREGLRLRAFERDYQDIAGKQMTDVSTADLSRWRDDRLSKVSAAAFLRDANILRHVFSVARKEWKWCGESPFVGLAQPRDNPARTRRVLPTEIRRICRWLGHRCGKSPATKQAQVALAFLIALRTAMRAGEILQLSRATIDFDGAVARIPKNKSRYLTGESRQVPLSKRALRLCRLVPASGFTINSASLDALFRKARDSLCIADLHFHDSRAEALTRMARRVDVLTLARISGHKDLRVLMDSYYRETSSQIAKRL